MNPDTGEIRNIQWTTPDEKKRALERARLDGFTVPLDPKEASELHDVPRRERRKRLAEMRAKAPKQPKRKKRRGKKKS